MSYAPLSFEDILEDMLVDWRNRVPGADTSDDGEIYVRCAVTAGAVWGLHHGLKYVENQIFPDTADSDNLERWAATYEITRKAAAAANDGQITLAGTNGTIVAVGLVGAHADGTTYTTTSGGTIAAGVLVVTAACDEAGTVGNKSVGTDILTIQAPPVGVNALASITTAFANGSDEETDAALLARVLVRVRKGNAGGTASDYEQWALTIQGCDFAYALPLRRGAGTVDVAVCSADASGNRIAASAAVRAAVLAYIDTVRPVTASCEAPVITTVLVAVTVALTVLDDGLEVADVSEDVRAAIQAAIYAVEPGGTLYLTQLMRAIAGVEGVIDFTISLPLVNTPSSVTSTLVQVLAPGVLTVT